MIGGFSSRSAAREHNAHLIIVTSMSIVVAGFLVAPSLSLVTQKTATTVVTIIVTELTTTPQQVEQDCAGRNSSILLRYMTMSADGVVASITIADNGSIRIMASIIPATAVACLWLSLPSISPVVSSCGAIPAGPKQGLSAGGASQLPILEGPADQWQYSQPLPGAGSRGQGACAL